MPAASISFWLPSHRMTGLSCETPAAKRTELWQRRQSIDAVRVRGIESLPRHHLPEAGAEFLEPVPLHGGVPHRIKRPRSLPCSRLERAGRLSRQSQALMDPPCLRPRLQPVALHRHLAGDGHAPGGERERGDLRSSRGEASQLNQALIQLKSVKHPLSMQSIQSRGALDLGPPPTDNGRILFKQADPACTVSPDDQQ